MIGFNTFFFNYKSGGWWVPLVGAMPATTMTVVLVRTDLFNIQ